MPVTVLYPEERQLPDDGLEHQIFGPEVRLVRRHAKTLADLESKEDVRPLSIDEAKLRLAANFWRVAQQDLN
jgi:predicted ATPase